tara:strand:- start:877 stop:1401 length:525 start_codon:yes stop_codon:yes gene_type:complete
MKINKEIYGTMQMPFTFFKGTLDLNAKYFISKIDDGIIKENSYKTNVRSDMTSWTYFLNDVEFLKLLMPILDKIDELKVSSTVSYYLANAWGLRQSFSDRTVTHAHEPSFLSGVIYLNNSDQHLIFPDINEKIIPKKGSFAIFSSFLKHKAPRNKTFKSKYGISFNLQHKVFND